MSWKATFLIFGLSLFCLVGFAQENETKNDQHQPNQAEGDDVLVGDNESLGALYGAQMIKRTLAKDDLGTAKEPHCSPPGIGSENECKTRDASQGAVAQALDHVPLVVQLAVY